MGDRQHIAAGGGLEGLEPSPKIARIWTPQRWLGCVGHHLIGFGGVVSVDHDPVHVVALDQRGPLVADKSGKGPRVVVLLGCIDRILPGSFVWGRVGSVVDTFRNLP